VENFLIVSENNPLFGIVYFFLVYLLLSCSNGSSSGGSGDTGDGSALPAFKDVINEVGIGEIGFLGQTAVWGDFNNDGCLDLFVANTDFDPPNVFLFRNNCDGTFHNVTAGSGIRETPLRSASLADFDNDGLLDLIVGTIMVSAPPILYKNLDGNTFLDVSEEAGIAKEGSTINHVVWADYDQDGFVDFFEAGEGVSFLYHNERNGTFSEVTEKSGIDPLLSANSAVWFDSNNDGFQDLFVAKDGLNKFYINNKDGSFTDMTDSAGVGGELTWRSVAACKGDFNRDGLFDLYVGNIGSSRNALYRNDGDGKFTDVTFESGTDIAGDARTCNWVDFDGDKWVDLFVTNHSTPSRLFKNMGNGEFIDVATQVGLDLPIDVFGSSWGDFNNDGFIDVFLNGHIGMALMKNSGTDSNFLILRLIGDGVFTNTSAIGTRVEIDTSSGIQIREVSGGEGCCSQDMLPVHFGLGNDKKVDIIVKWTSGEDCVFEGISVTGGQLFSVLENGCELIQN
jgi:hypothetical protein